MKRMIFSAAILLMVAGGVQAQTTEKKVAQKQTTSTHKAKKATAKKSTKAKKTKGVKATSDKLNDRRIYKADNGQAATPTGHQATGTGGGYAALKKDTAVIVPKAAVKPKKTKEGGEEQ